MSLANLVRSSVFILAIGCGKTTHPGGGNVWRPTAGISWDWQLTAPVNQSADVAVYDIDMFDNDRSVVDSLHQRGRVVVCYVDVGSYEKYRDDASRFPATVLGAVYTGFPDERWLDIRQIELLSPIMSARFDRARSMGCDAIEPDNLDGYDTTAHQSTGFPLTAADQLRYNRWIAELAHDRGMAAGLKNDINQVKDLVGDFEFMVSEQAFEYNEAAQLTPFIGANKPVFETEYNLMLPQFCPRANMMNVSAIRKHPALDAYREACR